MADLVSNVGSALLEDPICAALLSEMVVELLLSPSFRAAGEKTLGIAPFWAVKTLEKAEGSFVLSCLKAQAGGKNGGGKKGILMKLNTKPIQIQEKILSWQVDLSCEP